MEIYLVRHTSVDIPAGYAYGQTDVPLRPSFEDEAGAVKKKTYPAIHSTKCGAARLHAVPASPPIAATRTQKRKTALRKSASGNGK